MDDSAHSTIAGLRFTGYQLKYLKDQSRFTIVNKARRIGFTHVAAFKRAQRAAGIVMLPGQPLKLGARPIPQNIFSASHPQAKAALARATKWLRAFEVYLQTKLIKDAGQEIVRLTNGCSLTAFSSSGDTSRGFEGDVLLDEFAFAPKQRELWKAVEPIAARTMAGKTGYQVEVISTPCGDDDLFHELFTHEKHAAKFSRHRVSIYDAIADGFVVTNDDGTPVTAEDIRHEVANDDEFEQEYNCSFLASSQRYIPRELWEAACAAPMPDVARGSGVFGGMDIGAGGHESVIVDLERNGDVLCQLYDAERKRERDWEVQEEWARSGMGRRQRFAMDASGIGDQFGQRLEHAFPGIAESVKFTLQTKEQLATGLKLALARKKLRPLASDTQMMRDVLMLRRVVTAVGNVRYDASETKLTHADGAWALALAVYAAGGTAADVSTSYRRALIPEPSGISGLQGGRRRGQMF